VAYLDPWQVIVRLGRGDRILLDLFQEFRQRFDDRRLCSPTRIAVFWTEIAVQAVDVGEAVCKSKCSQSHGDIAYESAYAG
jgi:hypothetical protein